MLFSDVVFEGLFRDNPAAIAIIDADDHRFADVNTAFLEKIGCARGEVLGKTGTELGLFADVDRWRRGMDDLIRSGNIRNRPVVVIRRDGRPLHCLLRGNIIADGSRRYFLTVMIDVSEEVRLRSDLENERSRLANIIESARLGTWEWNVRTGEVTFNERWAEIVGYTLEELAPTSIGTWIRLAHPDDLAESDRRLRLHFEGAADFYECESRMRHKNGSWVWVLDRGRIIVRDEEEHPLMMCGTHIDITERRLMEDRIREHAIRDQLSGGYNRRMAFDRLNDAIAAYSGNGRDFCVSILDLDRFKPINDTYGHQTGDFVIREFVRIAGETIGELGLLGRYGGDEFIVVSRGCAAPEMTSAMEGLMKTLGENPIRTGKIELPVTFSCGIADASEFARDAITVESLLSLADARLYAAKDAGRNRCVGP